jgi:hypothetical protein
MKITPSVLYSFVSKGSEYKMYSDLTISLGKFTFGRLHGGGRFWWRCLRWWSGLEVCSVRWLAVLG